MNKINLIIWREFITRVRKPSFLIMTILGPVLIAGGILLTMYLASQEATTHHVLVIDQEGVIGTRLKDTDNVKFLLDGQTWTDSAFKASPYTVRVNLLPNVLNVPQADLYYKKLPSEFAMNTIRNELEKAIEQAKLRDANIDKEAYDRVRKPLDLKKFDIEEVSTQSYAQERAVIGFFFGYIMFIFIFMYGVQVMRGVMEEKQNRIVEVLIGSVKPFQLMMGKIIGIALVGFIQFILWIIITTTMLGVGTTALAANKFDAKQLAEQGMTSDVQAKLEQAQGDGAASFDQEQVLGPLRQLNIPLILGVFLFYFICGYLLYSSLLAAIGSAVDSETDTQQFMFPVTIPMVAAIIIAQMAVYNPESPAVFWSSLIPFTSPIVMMVRVAMGSAPAWQLLFSMALLVATFIGTTWLAGRIYRTGILMYGKKASWKEMGKWLFYKG
ncbi:MAG TPA: ABC transporter permease [Flavobacteriales bacterium]|nr:ABC transporter permease [Flavobacteriales bacterium]HNU57004.1 ABC transporter permease [Flavobacteriales bacterium]